MKKIIYLFIFLFLCIGSVSAEDMTPVFYEGNRLYSEGKYQEAEEKYQSILDTGLRNAALFYNLGNVYYKLGEKGKAVLYYRKALRLSPRDEELKYNLRLVQSQLKDQVIPTPKSIFARSYWGFVNRWTEKNWVFFFLSIYFLIIIKAIIQLFWVSGKKLLN